MRSAPGLSSTWRTLPGLVAAGVYPNPVPVADVVTTTTHKTLRGPRGGLILAREHPDLHKKLNSMIFPGTQGGPLMHVIAAKAVAFLEALAPEFAAYQQQVVANARAMVKALHGARLPHRFRRHRQSPVPARPDRHGATRARTRTRRSAGRTSPSTRTRCRTIRGRRSSPAGSGSGRPRSRHAVSGLDESRQVGGWIADVLDAIGDESAIERVRDAGAGDLRALPRLRLKADRRRPCTARSAITTTPR